MLLPLGAYPFSSIQAKERHTKGKAKADLAISKNKNTLRIKTTKDEMEDIVKQMN